MNKFSQLLRTRNAAGQPRPIDVGALVAVDAERAIEFADGLLLTLEDRAKTLRDEDVDTARELASLAGESIEAARTAAGKTPQTSRTRKDTADAVHAALVATGDLSLMLEAAGKLHTAAAAKQGVDPRAIFEKRRGGAR